MAIAFRASSNVVSASNTEITVAAPKPSGTLDGDYMLAFITVPGTGQSLTTVPAGWTLLHYATDGAVTVNSHWVYARFAASEPSSYTWGWPATGGGVIITLAYSGVSAGTPVAAGESGIAVVGATNTVTRTTPTITTADTRWLVSAFSDSSGSTWSGYSDTLRDTQTRTGSANLLVQDTNGLVAAGSYSRTATASVSISVGVQSIVALSEAGFGAPTGLTATPVSPTAVDLGWDAVPTATGYDVERDAVVIATDVATTTYSDTGLTASTAYDYRVRAVK